MLILEFAQKWRSRFPLSMLQFGPAHLQGVGQRIMGAHESVAYVGLLQVPYFSWSNLMSALSDVIYMC